MSIRNRHSCKRPSGPRWPCHQVLSSLSCNSASHCIFYTVSTGRPGLGEVDIGGSIRSKYKICICNHFSVYCFFPSGRETSGRNFLSGPQPRGMLQDSSGVMVLIDFVFCGICHTGHLQYHTGGDGGNTTGVTEQSHSMLPHILPCT